MRNSNSSRKIKFANSNQSCFSTLQGQIITQTFTKPQKKKKIERIQTEPCDRPLKTVYDYENIIKTNKQHFKSISPTFKNNYYKSVKTSIAPVTKKKTSDLKTKISSDKINKFHNIHNKKKKQQSKKIITLKTEVAQKKQKLTKKNIDPHQKRQKKTLYNYKSMERLGTWLDQQFNFKSQSTHDCTPFKISQKDIQWLGAIGSGTFGKVLRAILSKTGQIVAVKQVFQDPKYKNRQGQLALALQSDYTVKIWGQFYTKDPKGYYLNIVMDLYQCDLFTKIGGKSMNIQQIRIYSYQALRALLFIHSRGICHRDIKPQNMLVRNKKLVVCDFGSAKYLGNQPSLSYICSRCYRAPELILGSTLYTTQIDLWSIGCILIEMIIGKPLFIGQNSYSHLLSVMKVLGTPTKTQIIDMNPQFDFSQYKFPKLKKKQLNSVLPPETDVSLIDLISKLLNFSPDLRLTAAQALSHSFFDKLRQQQYGRQLQKSLNSNIFKFELNELQQKKYLINKLTPFWAKEQTKFN